MMQSTFGPNNLGQQVGVNHGTINQEIHFPPGKTSAVRAALVMLTLPQNEPKPRLPPSRPSLSPATAISSTAATSSSRFVGDVPNRPVGWL